VCSLDVRGLAFERKRARIQGDDKRVRIVPTIDGEFLNGLQNLIGPRKDGGSGIQRVIRGMD
jgi:hypothetical protein